LIQQQNPYAFALKPQSSKFIEDVYKKTFIEADNFLARLRSHTSLMNELTSFKELSAQEQVPVLKEVFKIEVESLGITAPKLIIDFHYKRAAFFDYDINSNLPGTVYINPLKTFKENKLAALSLLIHETRHSAQLQLAQTLSKGVLATGFRQAFIAQKLLTGKLGFSDFLTLNNEYEAFLFGNFVIHKLYAGREDMIDMGTFASQINGFGNIKIDLNRLQNENPENILDIFNDLQREQARLLGRK
jgi:hypothetical protein